MRMNFITQCNMRAVTLSQVTRVALCVGDTCGAQGGTDVEFARPIHEETGTAWPPPAAATRAASNVGWLRHVIACTWLAAIVYFCQQSSVCAQHMLASWHEVRYLLTHACCYLQTDAHAVPCSKCTVCHLWYSSLSAGWSWHTCSSCALDAETGNAPAVVCQTYLYSLCHNDG